MAKRNIVKVGEDILRKTCKPVKDFNENLWELLDDMAETMLSARGMGLAGPQVGVLKRVVVMDVNNQFIEMINPQILKTYGEKLDEEACLSVPNKRGLVKRPTKITVKFLDRFGEEWIVTGGELFSRCACHEIDHLNGILYIDKMEKEIKGGN